MSSELNFLNHDLTLKRFLTSNKTTFINNEISPISETPIDLLGDKHSKHNSLLVIDLIIFFVLSGFVYISNKNRQNEEDLYQGLQSNSTDLQSNFSKGLLIANFGII